MYISKESPADTDARLRKLIIMTRVKFYDGPYAFIEFPLSALPAAIDPRALALSVDNSGFMS